MERVSEQRDEDSADEDTTVFGTPSTRLSARLNMETTDSRPAPNATDTRPSDPAAHESIQRVLDQCVERGQIHRLYQWATGLNEMCHREEQEGS
jgi:hypothetical protein